MTSTPTYYPYEGKVITVTGAAQGIGLGIARYLATRGASLALSDVKRDQLEASADALRAEFPDIRVTTTVVDITKSEQVNNWIAATKETFGRLDGAVNNAGVMGKYKMLIDTDEKDWDFVVDINLKGTMLCLQAELRAIEDGGSIVNISSIGGHFGMKGFAPYVASKHAVIGLTRTAAKEVGKRQVRVNAVCPGPINSHALPEVQPENPSTTKSSTKSQTEKMAALGRTGRPEDIAAMVGYLMGDESRYATGGVFTVDGGWHC